MNEPPEWIKRLREHQTLHTGNCYCETDTRCDYDNRLIDFITTEKERSYAEGRSDAIESYRQSLREKVERMELDANFSGHYKNGYHIMKGEILSLLETNNE